MLRLIFKYAIEESYARDDPADFSRSLRGGHKTQNVWSTEQLAAFLEAAKGDELYPAFVLLCTTGMRRGEVLGLWWEDVDLENGFLIIRRQLDSLRSKPVFTTIKNPQKERTIYLDPFTRDVLREHKKNANGPWVFKSPRTDTGYHPNVLHRRFQHIVARAKLPLIRIHDLRHSAATSMIRLGVHPKVVSERFGHTNIQITMDLYGHASPGMDFEAANAMGDALFGEQDELERKEQQLRQELAVLAAKKQKPDSSKVVASFDSLRDAKALDATGEAGS